LEASVPVIIIEDLQILLEYFAENEAIVVNDGVSVLFVSGSIGVVNPALVDKAVCHRLADFGDALAIDQVGLEFQTDFKLRFFGVELDALPGLDFVLEGRHDADVVVVFVADFAFAGRQDVEIVFDVVFGGGRLGAHALSVLMLKDFLILDFVEFLPGHLFEETSALIPLELVGGDQRQILHLGQQLV